MTDPDVPIIVPEGKSATDLTMGELDIASYHLKADVLQCVAGEVPEKRYGALVEVAVMWAKRGGASENREALLKRFRDYTPDEIFHALRFNANPPAAPARDDVLDPTSSSDASGESSSLERSDDSPTS